MNRLLSSAVNHALWNGGSERKAWTDEGKETTMANDPNQTLTAYHVSVDRSSVE
jgi:hypothetical protein